MDKKNRLPVFKKRFEELFEESEVSQTEFANKLGLSRQTVGFYLNGDRIPDAEGILSLAKSCGVSSDWLLGLSDSRSFDKNIQIAVKTTGLSQTATEALVKLKEGEYAPILSALFESPHFEKMIERIYAALWCKKSASQRVREAIKTKDPLLNNLFEEHNPADLAERTLRTFSRYSDRFVIVPRLAQSTSYLQDAQAEMMEATKDAVESIERTQAMDAVLTKMAKIELQALCDENSSETATD